MGQRVPRIDRWQKAVDDFDGIRTGDVVKIAMGAGWEKGKVLSKRKDHVTVNIGRKSVAVWDARNIVAG